MDNNSYQSFHIYLRGLRLIHSNIYINDKNELLNSRLVL